MKLLLVVVEDLMNREIRDLHNEKHSLNIDSWDSN